MNSARSTHDRLDEVVADDYFMRCLRLYCVIHKNDVTQSNQPELLLALRRIGGIGWILD